jgi:hypothetical protein
VNAKKMAQRLAFGLLAFLLIFLPIACYKWMQPKMGENVASTMWVSTPEGAKNISFFGAGLFWPATAYEFDIREEAFLKWAQEHGWKLETINGDSPFCIETYKSVQIQGRSEAEKQMKEIARGYKYEYRKEDQGLYIGYDKLAGRAYVFRHTR